jgi:SAM-dependent methyltransferase
MEQHQDLIHWKSQAWFDPGMVAWYSRQMQDQSGINALKYRVEQDILAAYVIGPRLLDVGVGTGRGSIPFARRGLDVTAVDSSQAMLDECRRLAGEAPMRLLQADATRLPAEDGEYDSVMSLNLMVHLPHWQSVLAEWARVVRPGGRILFDINSLDHYNVVADRQDRYQDLIPDSPEGYAGFMLALSARDLVEFATAHGLAIIDLLPYGGFASDSSRWPWRDGLLKQKHWWRRQIEWVSKDATLFDFTLFLEQRLFAVLTTRVTGRFMVILEKRPDPVANQEWLATREALNQRLGGVIDAALLRDLVPGDWEDWRATLNTLLDYPRNRVLFGFLLQEVAERNIAPALDEMLDQRHLDALRAWIGQETCDAQAMLMASDWHACPEIAEVMTLRGVNMGAGLEYGLMRRLLRDYFEVIATEAGA